MHRTIPICILDRWSVFLDDARLDPDPDTDQTDYLGLSKTTDVETYRYTDADGWRVDITLEAVIPAQDGLPLAADIRVDFPDDVYPSLEITSPAPLSGIAVGKPHHHHCGRCGCGGGPVQHQSDGRCRQQDRDRSSPGGSLRGGVDLSHTRSFLDHRTGVSGTGRRHGAGRVLQSAGAGGSAPSARTRRVPIMLDPAATDHVPVHAGSPPVSAVPGGDAMAFPGLAIAQGHRFGFAPLGHG
ncbi:MAG: hypothetical protein ACOCXA_02660 [Planctomycetota bacterium]